MFERFLMICVGNICRSPMAEALFRERLRRRGSRATVESAGIAALEGRPADPIAAELVGERGFSLEGHRARQITRALAHGFELLLVMEEGHRRAIEKMFPEVRGRVQRLGRAGNFDIPDPYGGTRADFERALALIERGLDDLERTLFTA